MSDNSTPVSRMLHEDEAELNRLAAQPSTIAVQIRGMALWQRDRGDISVKAFQQWMDMADRLDG